MRPCKALTAALGAGEFDAVLSALYAPNADALAAARARAAELTKTFARVFGEDTPAFLYSAPGRTELGGNHTDHQRGRVLCAAVDADLLACAAPNGLSLVRVRSEGYPPFEVDLTRLDPRQDERGTPAALVRGAASGIARLGYAPVGFDVCVTASLPSGCGLSSSAACEVLLGGVFNELSCGGALSAVGVAKLGQYAENVFFGKPCGLMDQLACAVGGAAAIDLLDAAAPRVERLDCDLFKWGHALCLVDTGSGHTDLTADYAAIPREMGAVAAHFDQRFLREVDEAAFWRALPALRSECGDRAVLRAIHFFDENRRAASQAEALKAGDFARFLSLVNASGRSSALLLQNVWTARSPAWQPVSVALAAAERLLDGAGAARVHGGGFAGAIQAFVPLDRLPVFRAGMETLFGAGACRVLHIRPLGGCFVAR